MPVDRSYRQVDHGIKLTVKTTKGEARDMHMYVRKRVDKGDWNPVHEDRRGLKYSGGKARWSWDTKTALAPEEMYGHFRFEVWDGEEDDSERVTRGDVLVYHPRLDLVAVDAAGNPLKGVSCKVTIAIDDGFLRKGILYGKSKSEPGDHDNERVWRGTTDKKGKLSFKRLPLGKVTVEWERPWMVLANGWVNDDTFTETGPKRKAKLELTPTVHYVWGGNPKTPEYRNDASFVPNQMAALRVTPYFWRQRPGPGVIFGTDVAVAFNPAMIVKDIEVYTDRAIAPEDEGKVCRPSDLLEDDDGAPLHSVFMGRGPVLDKVVETLARYEAFSSVKDILSLCVLHKYGGYYFDTTTALLEANHTDVPPKLVAHDDLRIACMMDKSAFVRFNPHDRGLVATLDSNAMIDFKTMSSRPDDPKIWDEGTHGCDVWAMYAPPQHKALRLMLDACIERAENLGLHAFPTNTSIVGSYMEQEMNARNPDAAFTTINDVMTRDWNVLTEGKENKKKYRNHVIGRIIITAVQEGLLTHYIKLGTWQSHNANTANVCPPYMWESVEATDQQKDDHKNAHPCNCTRKEPAGPHTHLQATVPVLGIGKQHKGSWR